MLTLQFQNSVFDKVFNGNSVFNNIHNNIYNIYNIYLSIYLSIYLFIYLFDNDWGKSLKYIENRSGPELTSEELHSLNSSLRQNIIYRYEERSNRQIKLKPFNY